MSRTDYTEARRPIVLAIDECAELFGSDIEVSDETRRQVDEMIARLRAVNPATSTSSFEAAVADALALCAPLSVIEEDQ